MLFADDAAIAAHTQQEMQSLKSRFSEACKDFGLTISLKKTNLMGQDAPSAPATTINNFKLDSVHLFTYLGSTSPWTLRSIRGLERRLQHTLAPFCVWSNTKLTMKTKMAVYNACVLSTLLYGSETWTTHARQEKRLNTFQVRSIRRILGISWQDKATNVEVLSRAGLPTMYTLLRQRHFRRMEDSHIPKDILHGELSTGQRSIGRT